MKEKISQKGFIQIPILIAIILGVVIVGGVSYFGIRQYQNKQQANILESAVQKETEEAIKQNNQATSTVEISEVEKLRQEIENLKQESEKQKKEKAIQQQVTIPTPTPTPTPIPTPIPTPTPQPTNQSNFSDFTLTIGPASELKTFYSKETSSFENVNSNIGIDKTNTYRKIVLRKVVVEYIGNDTYHEIGRINIQGTSFKAEQQGRFIVWEGGIVIDVSRDLDISISFNLINKVNNYVQYKINSNGLYFYERTEFDTQSILGNQFTEKPIIIKGTFPILSDKLYGSP